MKGHGSKRCKVRFGPADPVAAFRARRFIAQHGRLRTEGLRQGESNDHQSGWWELAAADGWKLRCDWAVASHEETLSFTEIAPPQPRQH